MRLTWPLIGRSEEMRTIGAAISDPGLVGILVSGPAGVGKSRIVREGLSSLASRGFEPRWAVGTTSARKLPLGAFAPWTESAGTDRLQLVRSVIDSVTSAPPGKTVVLGVDDVHLLDELSTFVLHQIVQREAAKVVLTLREGESVPTEIYEIWRGRPVRPTGPAAAFGRRDRRAVVGRRWAARWIPTPPPGCGS